MNVLDVIKGPSITEKSYADAQNGKYTFFVAMDADKPAIKKAVEEQFSVKVLDIATIIVKGKIKRVGKRRTEKKITPIKKAIVKVAAGQKIEVFDLGEKK